MVEVVDELPMPRAPSCLDFANGREQGPAKDPSCCLAASESVPPCPLLGQTSSGRGPAPPGPAVPLPSPEVSGLQTWTVF